MKAPNKVDPISALCDLRHSGNHEWLFVILYSPLLILLREPLLFDRDLRHMVISVF